MNIIGSARHEKLMASANSTYMQVHEERNNYALQLQELQKDLMREQVTREVEERHYKSEIEALKRQLASNSGQTTTTTQKNKVEMRQEALQMAFPIAFDDDLIEEVHEHTDYPNVIYWNKTTFNVNDLPDDGDTFAKKYRFMEDEDGNHISQRRLDEIRAHLLDAFKVIKREMPSLIVEGWRNVNKELSTTCFTDLQRNFFEFTLCEKDWKANAFLTAWYPTITRVRPRKGAKGKEADVKREVIDIDMTEPTYVPVKRAAVPLNPTPGPSKKMKTLDIPLARDVPATTPDMPMAIDPLALKPKPKPKTNKLTKGPLMSNAIANTAPLSQALSPLPQDMAYPPPNVAQVPALAPNLSTTTVNSFDIAPNQATSPLPNTTQAPAQVLDAPTATVSNQLLNTPPQALSPPPQDMPSPPLNAAKVPDPAPNLSTTAVNSFDIAPNQQMFPLPDTMQAPALEVSGTRPIVMPKATANYVNNKFKVPGPITHSFNQDIPGPSETQSPPAGTSNEPLQKENINPVAPIAVPKKKGKQSTKQAVADDSNTPKNLFKKHWLTVPGNALESEFIKAWTSLQPEEKKLWKDQSNEMKSAQSKKKSK